MSPGCLVAASHLIASFAASKLMIAPISGVLWQPAFCQQRGMHLLRAGIAFSICAWSCQNNQAALAAGAHRQRHLHNVLLEASPHAVIRVHCNHYVDHP